MAQRDHSYIGSAVIPFRLVFLMWAVFSFEFFFNIDLTFLGIMPRTLWGLLGVVTAPMIHGGIQHLISNTFPLLFLGGTLFYFYQGIGRSVFMRCYFVTNILVWLFSPRQSFHIGASGLIYGLSAFLVFFGLLRRDFMSLFISIVVILAYGGIFYGVLPTDPRISWESHLAGFIVGTVTAFQFKDKKNIY